MENSDLIKKLPKKIKNEYLEWEEYGQIGLSAMKDFSEKISTLSGELRTWVAHLTVLSAAIIGVVVAFGREEIRNNPFLLLSLLLLIWCIIWGLLHIKNLLESQIFYIENAHFEFQARIEKVRKALLTYMDDPTEQERENLEKVKTETIDVLKNTNTSKIKKDWQITTIFWLFVSALLLLLISSFSDWNTIAECFKYLQNLLK